MEKREHRISLAKGEPKQNVGPVGVCKGVGMVWRPTGFSMIQVTWSATPVLLKWGSPPPALGTFGTVQRYLWLSQWVVTGISWVWAGDTAKHPPVKRTVPRESHSALRSSRTRAEQFCNRQATPSFDFLLAKRPSPPGRFALVAGRPTTGATISATTTTDIPSNNGSFHSFEPSRHPGTTMTVLHAF